ncbi:hypothetical protein [Pseudobacillus wudalianchiensis]|uniref:GHMP kinase N-terminal domain-containing protein n=1 Tax=Pseudobacillus wudalianchiensis TaxID=1743143 RepID=A0A1B9ANG7_9BACI|nr:hypothetical protein [Bacillus wudalianchiensis]OCA85198.1 hypothetical protein A8F95_11020 [Bacillus wudalianchiensis]
MKKGVGRCFGTFGELAQGEVDDHPFLFTLPVPLRSQVVFVPQKISAVTSSRPHQEKMIRAVELTLDRIGVRAGGRLYAQSQLPTGKGMASSSADITAAVRAVADSFDVQFDTSDIAGIAAAIEPTDGVMYEGIVSFNQRTGELLESFSSPPELFLLGYDSGGRVNTSDCYEIKREYTAAEREEMRQAYEQMYAGLSLGKTEDVLTAATRSATLNERFLPKPFFSFFVELAARFEAGVVVGHSGTVLGLLFNTKDRSLDKKVEEIKKLIAQTAGWNPFILTSIPFKNKSLEKRSLDPFKKCACQIEDFPANLIKEFEI